VNDRLANLLGEIILTVGKAMLAVGKAMLAVGKAMLAVGMVETSPRTLTCEADFTLAHLAIAAFVALSLRS